jgi:outer membrane biosynthesis protein TonB
MPSSSGASSVNLPQPPVPAGSRHGTAAETTAPGLERTQARYEAYVREKIRRVNERNMPHDLIKGMLSVDVAVTFELMLRRGGQIQSLRMVNSSGYRMLDGVARQVIYNSSPFEGYPQTAEDTIILTVIVHYYPTW